MVFLGSRACADLASKMHVVLRDSHADHTNINFETFHQNAALSTLSVIRHYATHQTQFRPNAYLVCSDTYSQQSASYASHHLTFLISQTFTSLSAYLYQKDERALPGHLQRGKLFLLPHPPPCTCSACHSLHTLLRLLSSSVSFLLEELNSTFFVCI